MYLFLSLFLCTPLLPRTIIIVNISNEKRQFCGWDVYPGSRIPIFPSQIPDPISRVKKIPDPGSASKNLSILIPKNCFLDPDLDFLTYHGSQIQESNATESRIRIRNTEKNYQHFDYQVQVVFTGTESGIVLKSLNLLST
jgi:hypothetical protein